MCYILFHRKAGLICAVPEDRPAPTFVRNDNWKFCGRLNERTAAPFDWDAAAMGVWYNGFYLFQPVEEIRPGDTLVKTSMASCRV